MGLWRRHLLAMDTQRLHLDLRLLAAKEGPVVTPLRPISHHKSEAAATWKNVAQTRIAGFG